MRLQFLTFPLRWSGSAQTQQLNDLVGPTSLLVHTLLLAINVVFKEHLYHIWVWCLPLTCDQGHLNKAI